MAPSHNLHAVPGKIPRRLHAEPGRDTRDEDPFAVQIDTGQNVLARPVPACPFFLAMRTEA